MDECVFCKIVSKEVPAHVIWEDDDHIAFLSRRPNTEGFSVVITKEHYPSYAFDNNDEVLKNLTLAAKKVGKLIDKAFEDVGRTGMIFEGFGVDHLHAKLFPMHGTGDMKEWQPIKSNIDKYFNKYEGYISSHDSKEASDEQLALVAEKIRSSL
jgi:histidine triad (HIT) family protein